MLQVMHHDHCATKCVGGKRDPSSCSTAIVLESPCPSHERFHIVMENIVYVRKEILSYHLFCQEKSVCLRSLLVGWLLNVPATC